MNPYNRPQILVVEINAESVVMQGSTQLGRGDDYGSGQVVTGDAARYREGWSEYEGN